MRSWFSMSLAVGLLITRAEEVLVFREGLAIGSAGRSGRSAFHTDAIEEILVRGNWHAPQEGESVTRADGTNRVWKAVQADKDGNFSGPELRGGYIYWPVVLDTPQIRVLDASGHNMVYVN